MNQAASHPATRRCSKGLDTMEGLARKEGGAKELLTTKKGYLGARTSFLWEMERAQAPTGA